MYNNTILLMGYISIIIFIIYTYTALFSKIKILVIWVVEYILLYYNLVIPTST